MRGFETIFTATQLPRYVTSAIERCNKPLFVVVHDFRFHRYSAFTSDNKI